MKDDRIQAEELSYEQERRDRIFWDTLDKRQKIDMAAEDWIEEVCAWWDKKESDARKIPE